MLFRSDELIDAVKRKLISCPTKADSKFSSGDLFYDLKVGHVKIKRTLEPVAAMVARKAKAPLPRAIRRALKEAKRKRRQTTQMVMFIDDARALNRGIKDVWSKVTDYDVSTENPQVKDRSAPTITDDELTSRLRELYYRLNSGNFDACARARWRT